MEISIWQRIVRKICYFQIQPISIEPMCISNLTKKKKKTILKYTIISRLVVRRFSKSYVMIMRGKHVLMFFFENIIVEITEISVVLVQMLVLVAFWGSWIQWTKIRQILVESGIKKKYQIAHIIFYIQWQSNVGAEYNCKISMNTLYSRGQKWVKWIEKMVLKRLKTFEGIL